MIARCNKWTESPIKMWNCEDFVKQHLWAERCKAVHERSTFWEVFLGCVAANGVTEKNLYMINNLRIGRWQAGEMLTPQLKPLVREILLSILDAPVLKEISALAAMEMEIYDGILQARARNKIETNNPIPCDMLLMEINWLWIDSVSLRLGGNCW